MGASTGDMLVDNPDSLDAIFRESPVTIVTHCEDTPTILENEEEYSKKYGKDICLSRRRSEFDSQRVLTF